MRVRTNLFIVRLSLLAAASLQAEPGGTHGSPAQTTQAQPSSLAQFRARLAATYKNPKPPGDFVTWTRTQPSLCSFKSLCGYFATNAESPYLYRTSQGAVPNYQLYDMQRSVESCLTAQEANENFGDPKKFEQKMKADQAQQLRTNLTRFQALKKSLQAHKEQDAYLEIEGANMRALLANKIQKIELAEGKRPSREKLQALLAANLSVAESLAHRKLSAESRARYLEQAFAQYEGIYKDASPFTEVSFSEGNQNPYLSPTKFFDAKAAGGEARLKANQASFQKNLDRVYGLFRASREAVVKVLEARRTPQNSAEIDQLKERLLTTRFDYAAFEPEMAKGGKTCASPNAFYTPAQHKIVVCPQLMELPDNALKATLAHELGHVIDPCDASWPLQALQIENMPKNREPFIPRFPAGEIGAKAYSVDIFDENDFSHPLPNGVKTTVLSTQAGIPSRRHPFASVAECLQGPSSIGARSPNIKALLDPLDAQIAQQQTVASHSELLTQMQASRKALAEKLPDHVGCSLPGQPKSQIQEAFADWVSAKVMAAEIAKAPAGARSQIALESVADLLALDCPLSKGRFYDEALRAMDQIPACQSQSKQRQGLMDDIRLAQRADRRESDSHPWSEGRVERIYAAESEYAKALGCTPDPLENSGDGKHMGMSCE